jgi:hypothetical protein
VAIRQNLRDEQEETAAFGASKRIEQEETEGTEEFRPYASPSRVQVIRFGVGVSTFQFWRLGGNHSGTYIRPPKVKCGDPTPAPVTKRKGEELAAQNLRTATELRTFVVRRDWGESRGGHSSRNAARFNVSTTKDTKQHEEGVGAGEVTTEARSRLVHPSSRAL